MCKELDPNEKGLIGELDWYKHEYYAMCDLYEELEAKTKDLIEKDTPKKPKHIHEEYAEHDWERNEDGTIDMFASSSDFHNGPMCSRCYYSFCVSCTPDGFNKEPCVVDEYHCPTCGVELGRNNKHCIECGQALDWSEDDD